MNITFQGHGIYHLLTDISWAMAAYIYVIHFPKYLPKIGKYMNVFDVLKLWVLIMIIPNATYAFFEIKHLMFVDKVAEDPNLFSYIVFGGISLLGFISTYRIMTKLVSHYSANADQLLLYQSFFSLVLGFGSVAGLLDFNSYEGIFFPPIIVEIVASLYKNPGMLGLALLTCIFVFATTLPSLKNI